MINSHTVLGIGTIVLMIYIIQVYRLYKWLQTRADNKVSFIKMLSSPILLSNIINVISGKQLESLKKERAELGVKLKNIFNGEEK